LAICAFVLELKLAYYSKYRSECQHLFSLFSRGAGSNMYLQGAELREEALCPANFIQRKGVQR